MTTVGWRSPLGGPRYDGPIPGRKDPRDGEWHITGDEIVSDVELEAPAAIVQDGSPTLGGQ